jgi:S-adenosylmethionine uptake transporter
MRGALAMTASMAAFTVNDAFMKAVSDDLPLFQSILLRGGIVVIALLALCYVLGQLRFDFGRRNWGYILLRTLSEMAGTVCFITALTYLPIANVSAILQALPLTVTLAGAVVFRERIGWRRLGAILIGFVGVMFIVQPGGADFNIYTLYGVAAVGMITIRDLAARQMSDDVPSTLVGLMAAVGVLLMASVGVWFEDWQPVTQPAVLQLSGAAVFIIGGYVFSVAAMRSGDIGFVAQFRYTSLLVAVILGVVVFDDIPSAMTMFGAGIVVAMGLFTLYRERRLRPLA